MRQTVSTHSRRLGLWLMLCVVVGCADSVSPTTKTADVMSSVPFVVSNATSSSLKTVSAGANASAAGAATLVYVSLAPNTLPSAVSVSIRVPRTTVVVEAPVVDGGFDPVAVSAVYGDRLEITVLGTNGVSDTPRTVPVPKSSPPIVVRTEPVPNKRDVPLNTNLMVVFSEPVNESVLVNQSIVVSKNSVQVPGIVTFADTLHTRVNFSPTNALDGGTDYKFVIANTVRDLDDVSLVSAFSFDFTTTSTTDIAQVSLSPDNSATTVYYESVGMTATLTDSRANPLTGRVITWSTSDPSIAIVSPQSPTTATVLGTGSGIVTVYATVEGKVASARIRFEISKAFIYSIEEGMKAIPMPPGVVWSQASAINDAGQVAGAMRLLSGAPHAFVWSKTEGVTDLGQLDSYWGSGATAINNVGQIAGYTGASGGEVHAFIWSKTTGMIDLGRPAGTNHSTANAINDLGVVVGSAWGADGQQAMRWSLSNGMSMIAAPSRASAKGINNIGTIVGGIFEANDPYGDEIGSLAWDTSGLLKQITLCTASFEPCNIGAISNQGVIAGVTPNGSLYTRQSDGKLTILPVAIGDVRGINDAGQVVGTGYSGSAQALIWSPTSGVQLLGALPGKSWSYGLGINNRGQVVGYSQ
ncbi:MAG: Ig-like domain-containing protein [Gemmatimonadaceae bacterium]